MKEKIQKLENILKYIDMNEARLGQKSQSAEDKITSENIVIIMQSIGGKLDEVYNKYPDLEPTKISAKTAYLTINELTGNNFSLFPEDTKELLRFVSVANKEFYKPLVEEINDYNEEQEEKNSMDEIENIDDIEEKLNNNIVNSDQAVRMVNLINNLNEKFDNHDVENRDKLLDDITYLYGNYSKTEIHQGQENFSGLTQEDNKILYHVMKGVKKRQSQVILNLKNSSNNSGKTELEFQNESKLVLSNLEDMMKQCRVNYNTMKKGSSQNQSTTKLIS